MATAPLPPQPPPGAPDTSLEQMRIRYAFWLAVFGLGVAALWAALLVRRPTWERLVLLASAVPIALVSNILRIAATAWCYYHFGREFGERVAHDVAGIAMMVVALVLVFAELRLLSWLFVETEDPALGRTIP